MKKTEKFLGVDIFKFEGWDEYIDYTDREISDYLQFTKTEWRFNSMSKYNGHTVLLDRQGYYKIIDINNPDNEVYSVCKQILNKYSENAVLDEGYLSKIPEFKGML